MTSEKVKETIMDSLIDIKSKINKASRDNRIVVGIAGGSCSGKSFISRVLIESVKGIILPMDDYYKGIEFIKDGNFDKPDAIDFDMIKEHIHKLKKGQSIKKPIYDFKTHSRSGYEIVNSANVIVLDGLFALHDVLNSELDIKIFVEADVKTHLNRRIERDVKERGRTPESVIKQFDEFVQPMHKEHVEPDKSKADYVIIND